MSDTPKIEDIDRPIELKQSKIAAAIERVGVSRKGLGIAAAAAVTLFGLIYYGVMNTGPQKSDEVVAQTASSDMPGQNQAINVARVAAEVEAKRTAESEAAGAPKQTPSQGGGLQVRGENGTPTASATAPAPAAAPSAHQTPAEQHKVWMEKKRYERIQGQLLAADAAVTADLTRGSAPGGGVRPIALRDEDNPLARAAAARSAAYGNIPAHQMPPGTAGLGGGAAGNAAMLAGGDPSVAAQIRNKEFLKEAAEAGYLPERVKAKMGSHELAAGSVIPAVMLTGINSDLPGVITAMVRQSIYSTFDESTLVVPQGARLVGRYSSQVAYGQERVLVAWDEMIMPNGNRINLRGMTGADGIGQSGFHDQVDTHFWRIWGSALMVSMLGVGVQLSQPQNSSYSQAPNAAQQGAAAAANSLNQAGSKVLERNLNLSPTLTIRPGYEFNVIVNRSVILPAYRE